MISVLLVDDEKPALDEMKYLLSKYKNVEIEGMIQDGREAFAAVAARKPDAVFLDIDMPGANGLELAVKIQASYPEIIIVFVTAYSEYALSAFRTYPLDYIMKPVDEKRFELTMRHLGEQFEFRKTRLKCETKICIRCFGNFEVSVQNSEKHTLKFATRQAREMFAYLVTHYERTVTKQDLIQDVFGGIDDKKTSNLLYVTAYNIRHALEELGIEHSCIAINGNYLLTAADGVCDYIDFSKFAAGNPFIDKTNIVRAEKAAQLYQGAFFESEDYIWAEEMSARMELQFENLILGISNYYLKNSKIEKSQKALVMLMKYNPYSDSGHRALLDLSMKTGNNSAYMEQYEAYAALLCDELQIVPEKRFLDYYEKINF